MRSGYRCLKNLVCIFSGLLCIIFTSACATEVLGFGIYFGSGPRPDETAIGEQIGVEPSSKAIGEYVDEILAIGNNGQEALGFVNEFPSASIEHEGVIETSLCEEKNCDCYFIVMSEQLQDLDRRICINEEGAIIDLAPESIELYIYP